MLTKNKKKTVIDHEILNKKTTYDQTECSLQNVKEFIISSDDDKSDFESTKSKKIVILQFRRQKRKQG